MVGGEIGGDVRGLGEESGALRLAAFLAACRVSCGLRAARNACVGGALGRGGHAAVCGLSRFLRPLGRSQRLREGALGRGGMPRFAACRVSCGLWAARNACAVRGGVLGAWGACRALQPAAFLAAFGPLATLAGRGAGAWGHAALCGLPRFLRPLGRSQRLRRAGWGAVHAAFCSMPRFLRPLGRSQRLLFCAAAQVLGALPQTPAGG